MVIDDFKLIQKKVGDLQLAINALREIESVTTGEGHSANKCASAARIARVVLNKVDDYGVKS